MELLGKLNRTKQPVVKETTAFETSVHNTTAVDTIPDDTTVAEKPAPSTVIADGGVQDAARQVVRVTEKTIQDKVAPGTATGTDKSPPLFRRFSEYLHQSSSTGGLNEVSNFLLPQRTVSSSLTSIY